jgi:hypothetical protein
VGRNLARINPNLYYINFEAHHILAIYTKREFAAMHLPILLSFALAAVSIINSSVAAPNNGTTLARGALVGFSYTCSFQRLQGLTLSAQCYTSTNVYVHQ